MTKSRMTSGVTVNGQPIETVVQSSNNSIESVKLDTLNVASQDYGKLNETLDAKVGIRNITITLSGYCGDGSDGTVTVSAPITLVRDMYYDNLTITDTGSISCAGYRIYCKNLMTIQTNGVVKADGVAGAT